MGVVNQRMLRAPASAPTMINAVLSDVERFT
jgi:hypothetical protein